MVPSGRYNRPFSTEARSIKPHTLHANKIESPEANKNWPSEDTRTYTPATDRAKTQNEGWHWEQPQANVMRSPHEPFLRRDGTVEPLHTAEIAVLLFGRRYCERTVEAAASTTSRTHGHLTIHPQKQVMLESMVRPSDLQEW